MQYTYTTQNKVLEMKFSGYVDDIENSGPDILDVVNDALNQGVTIGLLDISRVKSLNSNCIGLLILIMTKFKNKKGIFYLINPSEYTMKLLMTVKLDTIFNIESSFKAALKQITTTLLHNHK